MEQQPLIYVTYYVQDWKAFVAMVHNAKVGEVLHIACASSGIKQWTGFFRPLGAVQLALTFNAYHTTSNSFFLEDHLGRHYEFSHRT